MTYTVPMVRAHTSKLARAAACAAAALLCAACKSATPVATATAFPNALAAGEIASVLVVGDSISAGFGTPGSPEGSPQILFTDMDGFTFFEPDHFNGAWTNHLRSYLDVHGVDDFLNASISGMTFTDVDYEFDSWVGDGADAIIVMLGTNDSASLGPAEFEKVATRVLERISERCTYLLVIAPPKREHDSTAPTKIGEVESILAGVCADHGWDFISTYGVLEPGTDDFQADGLHPTTSGNDKLWDSIASQLGFK